VKQSSLLERCLEFFVRDVFYNAVSIVQAMKIYRGNRILYGCEIWSLTLREERKLRVFENMVLRRIFGPRRAR